ncbi:MAG: hypothetical protein DMF96_03675 [Acidobacteria bacterium]|nr:MAG: hypothetical protein DMF96_03675 [Acidobacteriota bacterium]
MLQQPRGRRSIRCGSHPATRSRRHGVS